jgi:hypothetical protein
MVLSGEVFLKVKIKEKPTKEKWWVFLWWVTT